MKKIIVIDPCYVTSDPDWDLMCKLGNYEDKTLDDAWDVIIFPRSVRGSYRDKDYKKVDVGLVTIHTTHSTASGDGSYGKIGVDSGMLSVCEVDQELYEEVKSMCYHYSTVEEAKERMEFFCSKI